MFELSVALKYLLPRRRQLSVSIIALLSMLVIALVVWLVLVFLSVTRGIEERWMQSLVALNAPMRVTPTDAYYDSYYYQIDSYSGESDYTSKTIREKLAAEATDPYDPESDAELPRVLPSADRNPDGSVKDLVKEVYAGVDRIKGFTGVKARDYEVALANLRMRLVRPVARGPFDPAGNVQSFVTQACYLGSFDGENASLAKTLVCPSPKDVDNMLHLLSMSGDNVREERPAADTWIPQPIFKERAEQFFDLVHIKKLSTDKSGWMIPPKLYPTSGQIEGVAKDGRLIVFESKERLANYLAEQDGERVTIDFENVVDPLVLQEVITMDATLDPGSLGDALEANQLRFDVAFQLQGLKFAGQTPLARLSVEEADVDYRFNQTPQNAPLWSHTAGQGNHVLPRDEEQGYGILLANAYRDKDILLGDRGYIAYYSSTPSSIQEQRIPVYVAGFYNPGLLPTGSRYVLVDGDVTADIRSSISQIDRSEGNGISVWLDQISDIDFAKRQLVEYLEERGLLPYWKIETFKEYEFAKPLVQQFNSDRNLLSLIAIIVILVACSNIISMLIVLVNDKRKEIGILQSMGASPRSIAMIFAMCGTIMGFLGSVMGISAAILTLHNLQGLITLLSRAQGHDAFQSSFFGGEMPNTLNTSVLLFVLVATVIISVLAGLIPAIKAARIKPATILRSE